ncbi:MAG: penicillin-binding transpeptidase domain-containing protein [Actinomycetes bacterium]
MLGASLALLVACSPDTPPVPPTPEDDPAPAAGARAAGVAKRDLTGVEFTGAGSPAADTALRELTRGMGPLRPQVSVGDVENHGSTATARLRYSWTFPGVPQAWDYQTQAPLVREGGRWKASWAPTLVEGQLTDATRLSMRRLAPERGELLGEDGDRIVTRRSVVRIGLDKSGLAGGRQASSARRLARLVGIDPDDYVEKVGDAGPEAFVEAIVFRADAEDRPPNRTVFAIPGALPIQDEQMLAPSRDFARPVIGVVGEATAELVKQSGGAVVAGDQVGLSGLQRRYDASMRCTPGVLVQRVGSRGGNPSPSLSAGTPSSSPSPSPEPVTAFEAQPAAGRDLRTTLNVYSQRLAERTLARTKPAAALVAIRPSTGAVLAAANSAGTRDQSLATVGQFAPGSTFKVASSLALLRSGLQPGSRVSCPPTVTVNGRRFTNYSDYPSRARGAIDLRTAVAHSCNTAFIGQRDRLSDDGLAEAAGSLGLGIDYDVGFASYFGSVPTTESATGRAAAMIGQGTVQASPLAMAVVAASVNAGRTVVPRLVEGQAPPAVKAKPLTEAEARQLRELMAAVVTDGSGRFLAPLPGPPVLAKTGTAEYGDREPLRTHAWMIGAQGDLAVAVFVADGESGSRTAGPLLERFLRGSR